MYAIKVCKKLHCNIKWKSTKKNWNGLACELVSHSRDSKPKISENRCENDIIPENTLKMSLNGSTK